MISTPLSSNQFELLTSGADQQKLFTLSKHEIDEGDVTLTSRYKKQRCCDNGDDADELDEQNALM